MPVLLAQNLPGCFLEQADRPKGSNNLANFHTLKLMPMLDIAMLPLLTCTSLMGPEPLLQYCEPSIQKSVCGLMLKLDGDSEIMKSRIPG